MYQDITQHLLAQYKQLKSDNAHGLTQRANLFASVDVQNEQGLNTQIGVATTRQQEADKAYNAAYASRKTTAQQVFRSGKRPRASAYQTRTRAG